MTPFREASHHSAERAIREAGLLDDAARYRAVRVTCVGPVPAETRAMDAHRTWGPAGAVRMLTPSGQPRLDDQAPCGPGALLVEIEKVTEESGGMSSWYGFVGIFLSVLVDIRLERVVDVRFEKAS